MHFLGALKELPVSFLLTSLALASSALPVQTAELTPENFKDSTATGLWFVEHFSPYCGHCRRFAPTWEKLVEDSEKEAPSLKLAQVNCAVHGDLCDQNGIKGYPTMLMFENGKIVEQYKGSREMDDLKTFIKRHVNTEPIAPPPVAAAPPPQAAAAPPSPPQSAPTVIINPLGEVSALTEKTFSTTLAQGPTFVKFFAPWCGHCKKLAPIWKQLARHLQGTVTVAEVNCDDHSALCKEQGIQGYPTLVYFGNGVKSEYNSGRKLEQLKAFAAKAAAAGVQPLASADELDKRVAEDSVIYLLLQPTEDSTVLNTVREASAPLLGSPVVYSSTSPELFTRYSLSGADPFTILVLKDHDARVPSSIYHGSTSTSAALKKWLLSNRLPTSLELTQDTFQNVMNAPQAPLVVIAAVTSDNKEKVQQRFRDVAAKWRVRTDGSGVVHGRQVVFTWMDAEKWKDWMKSMYGVASGEGKELEDVSVVIADHSRLVYFNAGPDGDPIKITSSKSIFSAVEDAAAGKLSYKNSENLVERLARYLNTKLGSIESYVIEKPYHAVFFLVIGVAVVFWILYRLIGNDIPSERDYKLGKNSRLD